MVFRRRVSQGAALRHFLVAGGSLAQWVSFTEGQWDERLDDVFDVARRASVEFVTIRPHEVPSDGTDGSNLDNDAVGSSQGRAVRRDVERDGIRVVVDPVVDGRDRIRRIVSEWPHGKRLTEKSLGRALFGDAGEPDLVVVLGPSNRLPPALVWELAYGELVFVDTSWQSLSSSHLHEAIDEYTGRQRRFGGVE